MTGFTEVIFGRFFRWLWAAVTGFASLISLVVLPDNILISKVNFVPKRKGKIALRI